MNKNVARITQLVTAVDGETPEFLGAVCPPTFETTVFKYRDFEMVEAVSMGKIHPYGYARTSGTPTGDALNRLLAAMENGESALTLASGSAAIFTAMISCLKAGDHVIMDRNAYGRALGFLKNEFARFGVTHTLVTMKNTDEVEAAIRPETALIYMESPNSWMFEVQDIRAIAALARKHGIRTIIDNTYSTPVYQNPIDMGVDVVLHSATKYLGGHSATIAGVIVSTRDFISHLAPVEAKLPAHEASKLLLNLRTLPLRMERHYENAKKVSAFLEKHSKVQQVFYPGSPNHPQRALIEQQMYGASGTLSFVLDCDREGTRRFFNALRTVNIGGTWGTYECTIQTTDTTPDFVMNTEYTTLLPHQCRLSVGLESADEILEDLDQALSRI